ncbi:MAG: GntR family transcriptional regulator [Nocardioides sp.]|nr:GntR family transcriptional regulator [Nocardioides sp.]
MALGYRELAAELREGIERGDFPPGSTLPKQSDLAEQYGVNVKTIRNAVGVLDAEGLVTPVRRRGTVVRERPPMRRLGAERYAKSKWKYGDSPAFIADREASGQSWQRDDQTQTVELVQSPARAVEVLGVDPSGQVYARARVVRQDGQPTTLLTSYYRVQDVEGTPLVDQSPGPAGKGGGFAVLTLQGLEPHEVTETFHARMPTPEEAEVMELPAGEPVMVLERVTRTKDGYAVEYAEGAYAASRFSWSYTFEMPD